MGETPSFELSWGGRILTVKGTGFWTDELMTRYEAELKAMIAKAPKDGFGFLVELQGSPAQDVKLVQRHVATNDWLLTAGCRAVATVLDSAVLRLQVQRAAGTMPRQGFASASDARSWLLSQF